MCHQQCIRANRSLAASSFHRCAATTLGWWFSSGSSPREHSQIGPMGGSATCRRWRANLLVASGPRRVHRLARAGLKRAQGRQRPEWQSNSSGSCDTCLNDQGEKTRLARLLLPATRQAVVHALPGILHSDQNLAWFNPLISLTFRIEPEHFVAGKSLSAFAD